MDLCSKHYGFLHLPSLAVFVNPYSPYPQVRAILTSRKSLPEMAARLPSLSPEERQDLAHRLTTLIHERRHFHDVLLSVVGNSLFFTSLIRSVALCPLRTQLDKLAGQHVILPLNDSTPGIEPGFVDAPRPFEEKYARVITSSNDALEASAVLTQLVFAVRHASGLAFLHLVADFLRDPHYGSTLAALGNLLEGLDSDRARQVLNAYHRFLLIVLSESPLNLDDPTPDDLLKQLLEKAQIVKEQASAEPIEAVLNHVADSSWDAVDTNTNLNEERIKRWMEILEGAFKSLKIADGIAEYYRGVAREFAEAASRMRSTIKSAPLKYTDPVAYLDSEWPEPFTYFFREDGSFEPTNIGQPWEPFTRKLWYDFTIGLSPTEILLEKPSFRHPLQRMWLQGMRDSMDVIFRRR